jgi:hypothetical protein
MSSRFWGSHESNSLQRAIAVSVVGSLGRVVGERIANNTRLVDVSLDASCELIHGCEVIRSAALDTHSLQDQRVLVLILGDGRAVVVGVVGAPDRNLTPGKIEESEPDTSRGEQHGETDRVIEHAGSKIVLTGDGDIVLQPRRAVRVQGNLVRLEGAGSAEDNPVVLQAFLRWAGQVERQLMRMESWLTANSPLLRAGPVGPLPALPPTIPASIPDAASSALGASAIKIPTGDT